MTKVYEVFNTVSEHPGTHDEVVEKLVAMGWVVIEQKPDGTKLNHELIPGSSRIVLK